ncbi:MAG: SH3 domain-containing protein [Sulfurospirillaceae bacterium]|nr:SH3 domain-containing protein [Sulfurospirillaceae bacterium]
MKKIVISSIIAAGLLISTAQATEAKASVKAPAHKTVAHKHMVVKGEFITKKAALIRNAPSRKGKIVAHLKKGKKLSIQSCDKYSWCKLKGKKEFISRDVLKRAK